MTAPDARSDWYEANQRYLTASLDVVRDALERATAEAEAEASAEGRAGHERCAALAEAEAALPAPAALELLCTTFGLSSFERDVLLLCAGAELDSRFARLCGVAQGDLSCTYPTFGLALALLPDAHWSALTAGGPLRYWRLVEAVTDRELTGAPLRIDERVLHFLTGLSALDERLIGLVEPLSPPSELPESHAALARRLTATWRDGEGASGSPLIELYGLDHFGKLAVVAAVGAEVGLPVFSLDAAHLPAPAAELEQLARLWQREALLTGSALLVDCSELEEPGDRRAVFTFLRKVHGRLVVVTREPMGFTKIETLRFEVGKPTTSEQRGMWNRELGPVAAAMNGQVEAVVEQFQLGLHGVRAACSLLRSELESGDPAGDEHLLWDACRDQARPRLENLAERIDPAATWDDLVLPVGQLGLLREISVHVRHRNTVYETWGFAAKCARGLGISTLFAGPSGTGKTMAAEVLANELRLDLYRIDLSQVVSKYIGETEKNLRKVFDAAENGGAILLFDEADALFGKRSDVKDSHDRYANIEVSFLLQRMEAYRGLAILTTNLKKALDQAFLRRIRFIVEFPIPDASLRAEIWRRIFPVETPVDGLDFRQLAQMSLAGGSIRNIAMNAAFLAADRGEPVRPRHVLRAARAEYAKLERPLSTSEAHGWAEGDGQ